jgi:hypothetical protein
MIARRRFFAALTLLAAAACSSKSADKPAAESTRVPDLDEVVYVNATTDEALDRLLNTTAKDDPKQYVLLDSPDVAAPVSANAPATFAFHPASNAANAPVRPARPEQKAPPVWRRPLRELLQLLGPPREAFAHGAAFNGTGYFLEFIDAGGKPVHQAFTDLTSYTPEADAWQDLVEAEQPLTLRISSAFFEDNMIPSDGGPFVGGSFQFSIE